MKNISTYLFLFLLLLTACQPQAKKASPAQEGQLPTIDEAGLMEALKTFNEAFSRYEVEVLKEMTTPDYRHTNGSSPAIDKEEWLSYLRSQRELMDAGKLRLDRYEMTEVQMYPLPYSAVINGKVELAGERDGEAFDREIRVSHFWVKTDGQWKRAGFHDTRIE